jgi:hypothetical protein
LAIRQIGFDQILNPVVDVCFDDKGNILVYEAPQQAYAFIDGGPSIVIQGRCHKPDQYPIASLVVRRNPGFNGR